VNATGLAVLHYERGAWHMPDLQPENFSDLQTPHPEWVSVRKEPTTSDSIAADLRRMGIDPTSIAGRAIVAILMHGDRPPAGAESASRLEQLPMLPSGGA
jgi:hypothetical protein